MLPVVLKQLENYRFKQSHSVSLTSEEGYANQMSKPAFPAEPVMTEVVLLSEAEWDAKDYIRIFRCLLK